MCNDELRWHSFCKTKSYRDPSTSLQSAYLNTVYRFYELFFFLLLNCSSCIKENKESQTVAIYSLALFTSCACVFL